MNPTPPAPWASGWTVVWRPLSSKKTQAGPLLSIIIQIWNGPETKNRQHLVTSFKKPHSISQVMHLRKSLAVFWSIVCIFSCVYVCSYTSTCGYYTLPFAVTTQDAMLTVSWGSVYWNSPNSPIELFHLKTKPQRCNILPLPRPLCQAFSLSFSLSSMLRLQTCIITVFTYSGEGTQILKKHEHCMTELSLCPSFLTKTYI